MTTETYPRAMLQRPSLLTLLQMHDMRIRMLEMSAPASGSGVPIGSPYDPEVRCGSTLLDPTDGSFVGGSWQFGTLQHNLCVGELFLQLGPDVGLGDGDFYQVSLPTICTGTRIIGYGRAYDAETKTAYLAYLQSEANNAVAWLLTPGTDPEVGAETVPNAIRPTYPWDISEGDTLFDGDFFYEIGTGE